MLDQKRTEQSQDQAACDLNITKKDIEIIMKKMEMIVQERALVDIWRTTAQSKQQVLEAANHAKIVLHEVLKGMPNIKWNEVGTVFPCLIQMNCTRMQRQSKNRGSQKAKEEVVKKRSPVLLTVLDP